MKQKLLSVPLAACMAIAMLPTSAMAQTQADAAFSDTSGHWAEDAIDLWSDRGVIRGNDGVFRPDAPIARAEFAAVLNRTIGYGPATETTFADVPAGAWYAEDVSKLCAAGVMRGDGNGMMRPLANVTREEAAVLFARAFDIDAASAKDISFPDRDDIAPWAQASIRGMRDKGYISGDANGDFNPGSDITRAEVVTVLNNIGAAYYGAAGAYEGDVDGNVIISAADVSLKNMKISGDLYIMEGVGEGDVELENVEVAGRTFARGGGGIRSISKTASSMSLSPPRMSCTLCSQTARR